MALINIFILQTENAGVFPCILLLLALSPCQQYFGAQNNAFGLSLSLSQMEQPINTCYGVAERDPAPGLVWEVTSVLMLIIWTC